MTHTTTSRAIHVYHTIPHNTNNTYSTLVVYTPVHIHNTIDIEQAVSNQNDRAHMVPLLEHHHQDCGHAPPNNSAAGDHDGRGGEWEILCISSAILVVLIHTQTYAATGSLCSPRRAGAHVVCHESLKAGPVIGRGGPSKPLVRISVDSCTAV